MPQNESINNTEDYVNYTFHISSKGVGTVAGELVGLSNTVSNLLGDIAFKTSEMLSHTETLAIGTGIAVGAMFTSAMSSAVRFEQQMANVKAIGGESLNAQEIGNAAMEYSNKFGMAVSSMTEGLEALSRAGITTTSVMSGVLEEGVKLSKLEGMDLEDSINDLISTTNLLSTDNINMNDAEYGEMVKQMNQHIVSTSESAPINAQNIIQSLQHVGGYASASGMDQDDLFAVIAQLGSRGTKGEMAGTALRAFIAAGQKDTAQRALDRIGLNVTDLWNDNGETMLSISEMKDVLDQAMEKRGYSKQEKLEFYSDFAGYKQANQIMKIDTSEVKQYKEQIANSWDLGKKLDTILGTVRGNLDRIWQIAQNFMTKIGGKFLMIANAILTPVRILLELINKMPFADTAVAAGMIIIGFSGVLKIINNIVPRFSTFFIQLSQSKRDALSIRNIWRNLPDDITKAKDVLKAMSDPKKMMQIQQDRQLYSQEEIEVAENKVAKMQFIQANLDDPALSNLTTNARKTYLGAAWDKKDESYKQNFINTLKTEDPKEYERMMKDYFERVISDSNLSASRASYDMVEIMNNEETALWEINEYVGWIYRSMGGPTVNENGHDNNSPPPSSSHDTRSNRQRNARINERKEAFRHMGNNILGQRSEYGDYSYKVNPNINMPQFNYNDIEDMRRFEAQVKSEIQRKTDMYANFFEDSSIEEARKRLKKSLTISAKTDLGYEFSTGANTSDIKKILETGNIREGSSHILDEQLQTIADILETELTGNRHDDMRNFSNILNSRDNKDELLASILDKTQEQWNSKYYNNGKVGYFPTNTLKEASGGATAQKIMEKVGVNSIEEVQEHFKTVALDDTLLNECVDIMYQDKELVEKLVNEEIKYMYENLARVQNSISSASRERHNNSTFHNKGEDATQKAKDYVLADFNPKDFSDFTSSPYDGHYDLFDAIEVQNDDILYGSNISKEDLEGFQGYIYPIGRDISGSQRYGNDNFEIRNIKYVPSNDLLKENVAEIFLEREDSNARFDFMASFAEWVHELASHEGNYWDNSFTYYYAVSQDFEDGEKKFDKLKSELEEIYRAYVDLSAYGAQSLIESTELYGPTVSFRSGSFYTPENEFGAFDTITSTSLIYGNARQFMKPGRDMLKIYNPEDIPGVIAHYDILNDQNDHLWSREHELTLGQNQPYLHIPNPNGSEKTLLTLTPDQQKAVKEIMGEDFEFQPNNPNLFLNAGESSLTPSILTNQLALMLNKDNLTKNNMGEKLQDLIMNGAIVTLGKYTHGELGGSNIDDTISINPGIIKYHSDNYNEKYGDYGMSLLDTVLHEMSHVALMHKERTFNHDMISPELAINDFEVPIGYDNYKSHFVAEFEAQYVSSQVLNRLGFKTLDVTKKRMAKFHKFIEENGHADEIQYELLDTLVDEMLNNISTIGDITKELSTQFDMVSAGVTSAQVSEDMRPILSRIQAFNKDSSVYQGPNANGKRDEVDQILSDMANDIDELQIDLSNPLDLSRIYNAIAQKYTPYIESLNDGFGFDKYFEYALRKSSTPVGVNSFKKEGAIEKIWNNAADGGDLNVLNKIKKYQLHDPEINDIAPIFYGTWGDKRFNYHINEFLRRETSDSALIDLRKDIPPEMSDIFTKYDIKTISDLSTMLGKSLLKTKGLPFDTRLHRMGKLNTSDSGFGILTGVTSTAYDSADIQSYKNGSGDDEIEILAPAGTQGMNLYDWEYTLAPNTPYIELGQYENATRILLLPPKQQRKYGFYPEGFDDSYRIGVGAAVANNGIYEDIEHFMDGIYFDDRLYDNESILRGLGTDGSYYYYNEDDDTILISDYLYDLAEEIDESFINAQDAVLNNFSNLTHVSKETSQEIVSNFIANRLKTQRTTSLFQNAGEDELIAASKEQQLIYDSLNDFKAIPGNSKKTVIPFNELKKHIMSQSDKETAESAIKWIKDNYGANGKIGKMLGTSKNGVYISRMKKIIEANSDLSKVVSDYIPVHVTTAEGKKDIIKLPLHSAKPHYRTNDDGEYILDDEGNKILDQGYMNKFIHRSTKIDMTKNGKKIKVPITHEGITDIIDTDEFKKLPREEQAKVYKTIIKHEGHIIKDVQAPDDKIKKTMKPNRKFGVINTGTTGLSCPSSVTKGTCPFPEHCYARRDMIRLPNVAKNQMQKAAYFTTHSVEELVQDIVERNLSVVRINQEGDIASIKELEKVIDIANALPEVDFYGYTKSLDVLQYMWDKGLPKNLTMNNSLGTSETGNYVAASFYELADLIEDGYQLCFGACAECSKCTKDFINKVTLLRDGGISQIFSVEDLKDFTSEGQVAVLRRLYNAEANGQTLTRELVEHTIKELSQISEFAKKSTGTQTTLFSNKGEDKLLPVLADYHPIDNSRRDEDYIESLGYGGMDRNVMNFFDDVYEKFGWDDDYRRKHNKRRLPEDHWGIRTVMNDSVYDSIGTQTGRLLNYGIYYNRQSTGEAKSSGIEEVVNLFNKDATKKAFMENIISYNQLKKWHKQLQDSAATDNYGEVPWGQDDIQEWKKEKDEADRKLEIFLEKRAQKIQEMIAAQDEIFISTLPIVSLMSVGGPKTVQSTLTLPKVVPPGPTQSGPFEWGMPELVENYNYIKYKNEMLKQQARARAEQTRQQYSHIRGAGVNIPQDHSMPGFSSQAYIDFQNKYAEQGDYLFMNKWDKARYKLNQDDKDHKIMNKGIDIAEWLTNTIQTRSSEAYQHSQEYANEHGSENLEFAQEKMGKIIGATEQFRDTLSGLAEVFPILTPAVEGLNIALQAEQLISTGLEAAIEILNFARIGETESTFLQTMANWANSESALQAAAGQMVLTGVTWLASAAEGVLAFIRGLGTGPLLILAAAILAVVAAVELLKFWENKHAEALKESQKALEESTAKNNIALSQYKDLKKARENETDAIKKQQAARKEAIALYELEAARVKKRKAVHDEAKLRNDVVWGEYGLRASLQKMGLGFMAGGDFESQYEKYDGTTANIRQIKEASLGNLFASSEQRYVSSIYDNNSMFFAEVEAYKQPLQELYDKESKLIEQYGSIDLARGSQEFYDAVQEFADATGINGETAVKMLEWLETENKVDQATKVGQAQISMIRARADAKVAGLEYGEGGDLNDMNTLGNAMVLAQFQEMMNTAKTEVWWELLYAYLDTLISILVPWKWGDIGKNLATVGIRQEELAELDAEGNNILNSMYEQYEEAERRDYGSGISYTSDTPFGGALDSAAVMYAEDAQQKYFNQTGHAMTEDDYQAIKTQYQEDTFNTTNEGLKQQKNKEDREAYEKAKANKQTNKAKDTLGQLQNNGEQAHTDALAIIDAIKNPGVVSGLGAGVGKVFDDIFGDMLIKDGLDDLFTFMRGEGGTATEKGINVAKNAKAAYAEDGLRGVYNYGKQGIKNVGNRAIDFLEGQGINVRPYAEKGVSLLEQGKTELQGLTSSEGRAALGGKLRGIGARGKDLAIQGIERVRGVSPNAVSRAENALTRGRTLASEGIEGAKDFYKTGTLSDVVDTGKSLVSKGIEKVRGVSPNAVSRAENALSRGKGLVSQGIEGATKLKDGAKAAYVDDGLKGLANFGKETGKSGIKGLANVGKAASAEAGGLRGLASGVSSQVGGIRGLTSGAVGAMKATFSPSALKGGFKDIGKGLKGGGTLMKGIGRVGGAALMALGPALAFADKASELNPFEGPHYNEDGTEKKALQATGEVVGTTAGALGGVAGGLEGAAAGALVGQALIPIPGVGAAIGAVAGGIAGGWLGDTIFQPIGEAIGGTIGWLGDNLLGGIQDVAGTVWDGLTGAAGGVWDAVSGAASGVWDFLTGGENSDKPVGGLLGLTPIGMGINAAAGIGEWLFGGENDPYQNVQTQGNEGNKKAKQGSGNTIIIKNININTEDDPEKIKSALMNLIIEMQEQIAPRQVSRTVGEPPSQSTSTTQNENNTPQAEGTDAQSGEQNGDQNNNPTT